MERLTPPADPNELIVLFRAHLQEFFLLALPSPPLLFCVSELQQGFLYLRIETESQSWVSVNVIPTGFPCKRKILLDNFQQEDHRIEFSLPLK
jgi:hypothetical protein